MKKNLNVPENYVDETLAGHCAAHPETYRLVGEDGRMVIRATPDNNGKLGSVSAVGSGHLPVFSGHVGYGLRDACAVGNVFATPSAHQMAAAIRSADQGPSSCVSKGTTAAT